MPTTEEPQPAPGYLVRRAREACRLTQETFADKLGTSQQTVSRWESGHVRVPVKYVNLIAQTIDMDGADRDLLLNAVAYQAQNPTVEYGKAGDDEMVAMLTSNQERVEDVADKVDQLADMVNKLIALLGERSSQ